MDDEWDLEALDHPRRNFSSWRWFRRNLEEVSLPLSAAAERETAIELSQVGADQLAEWRRRARAELRRRLGPLPDRVPLAAEVLDSTDCGSYRRDHIVFDTERHMSVPAYLLVPHDRTRRGPAVLAQHGHGPGKDEVCGLAAAGAEDSEPNTYAHELAELGYVVLAPDLRTFGERADWNPENIYACDHSHMHATMLGRSLLALDLWDLARGLDVLAAHPLVDPRRLGMVGLSQGGTCTLFLAAWDRRVRACVVSGYFNEWASCVPIPWNMCGSQVLPGIVGRLDHVHLAALIAPRAMLIESGTEDGIFPIEAARRRGTEVRHVYAIDGAPERFDHHVFEGGHQWHGGRAYPFLARFLGSPR